MFTPYYRTYLDATVAFVRSICIKDTMTPEAQNTHLEAAGYPVGLDKFQWKYYLNLAGEYHPTDRPIYVISADTQERIFFDKRVLVDHPLTRQEYGPGGPFYRDLCNSYPEHVELIQRILRPVDITTAVNADAWTILDYDPQYVGEGETLLMKRIQDWVTAHTTRWHIGPFGITHGLYPASMLAVMYQHMVPAIINIRAELSRTAQAADFHIWAYLGSRLRLDRFQEYLDHRQSMFLYRNIDYIQTHVGKESTMRLLQDNITRPTNLHAYRYDITQSDNELIEKRLSTPQVLVSPYQAPDAETDPDKRLAVSVALELTRDVARYNDEDLEADIRQLEYQGSTKVIDALPTGLVEMRLEPPPNEVIFPPDAIRVGLWFKLASQRRYQTKFEIDIGEVGSVAVTPLEACWLLLYCSYREKGIMPDKIPGIHLPRLPRYQKPTVSEVNSLLLPYLTKRNYANAFVNNWFELTPVYDVDALVELSQGTSMSMYLNWILSHQPSYAINQSVMADVHQVFYPRSYLDYGDISFDDFIAQIELPVTRMDEASYSELGKTLLRIVGGVDIDDHGISSRHRAMIDIMRLLTSYGIIFVDGEHLLSDLWIDLKPVMPIDNLFETENHQHIPLGLLAYNTGNTSVNAHKIEHITPDLKRWAVVERHSSIAVGLDVERKAERVNHRTLSLGGAMPGMASTIIE